MDVAGYIGIIATIIGAFATLYGLLSKRDSKVANDSEWKGEINTKLNMILGINNSIDNLEKRIQENTSMIIRVDESCKQAHKRIDNLKGVS